MRTPSATVGVWILVVIAALVVGWIQFGPDSSRNAAGEGSPANPRARTALPAKSAPAAGREARRSKSPKTAEEMKSAVTIHLALSEPTETRRSFAKILMALTAGNAEATVVAWMAGRGSPNVWTGAVKGEYAALIKEWGRIDGAAAMAFADRLETGLNHKGWSRNSAISGYRRDDLTRVDERAARGLA